MKHLPGVRSIVVAAATAAAVSACGPGTRPSPGGGDVVDAQPAPDSSGGGTGEVTFVYAHTATELYKVDPDTLQITKIGAFQWSNGSDQMTDLAIDKTGRMVGVSFGAVYEVDPTNAKATRLSTGLTGQFNGLSFVPASMLGQTGDDVLVGTRNEDGVVSRIDPMTGQATAVGNMGAQFQSSGDLVAVAGFGTVQTTLGAPYDVLSKLAPVTFQATPAPNSTGVGQIWGVAFWKGTVFGFTQQGQFLTIDPNTGRGTVVQTGGPAWWGAAVITTAPVIQ
jgi:hypothetical protein